MSLYKQFKTDERIEQSGVWLEYGNSSNGKPVRILIARAGGKNSRYVKTLETKFKPFRRQFQNETMENDQANRLLIEVYAESVVLGWENVEDEKGTPLAFNKDNVVKLFTDLPDLFTDVREQAMKQALFKADISEADSKN
jgi:hypothetical protein